MGFRLHADRFEFGRVRAVRPKEVRPRNEIPAKLEQL